MNYFKGNITGSRVELLSIQNASINWIPFHKYTSKNNSSTKSAYIASSNTFCHFVKVYIYIYLCIYILSTFLALHACIQLQWSHWMLDASIWLEYGPSDASTLKMKDFSLPEFIRVCFVLEDSGMSSRKLCLIAESYPPNFTFQNYQFTVFGPLDEVKISTRSFEKQLPRGRGKKTDTKYEIPWNCQNASTKLTGRRRLLGVRPLSHSCIPDTP